MASINPLLLIVEDDPLVRLTLAEALSDDGFVIIQAEDAEAAMGMICDRADIAAMLTDINLACGPDGFALARAARAVRPSLPVVYASGRNHEAVASQSVPGARFLSKPFSPSSVGELLHALIDGPARPVPVGH